MADGNLAYEIRVNDGDPVVAGSTELDVLSAMLTHVRERGGCDLSVAGLVVKDDSEHEHVRWLSSPLTFGDTVTIRVIESDDCDPPIAREKIDPSRPRRSEEQAG